MTVETFKMSAFESLGDNCEFGFLQKRMGCLDSGLLRWAVTSPEALLMLLSWGFSGFYEDDQLAPSSEGMVKEKRYGIYLHSKMKSARIDGILQYAGCEQERRATYLDERARMDRLAEKLLDQLETGTKIFVYKRNGGVGDEVATAIARRLRAYNADNVLLLAGLHKDRSPGSVWWSAPGLLHAAIDKFAPYDKADTFSLACWEVICRQALALVAERRP